MTHPITRDTVSAYDRENLHDRLDELLAVEAPDGVRIAEQCLRLAHMLAEKNSAYGNSALQPIPVLSHLDAAERLAVRIDDKINRLAQGLEDDEDVVADLAGYLVLLMIVRNQ